MFVTGWDRGSGKRLERVRYAGGPTKQDQGGSGGGSGGSGGSGWRLTGTPRLEKAAVFPRNATRLSRLERAIPDVEPPRHEIPNPFRSNASPGVIRCMMHDLPPLGCLKTPGRNSTRPERSQKLMTSTQTWRRTPDDR